MVDETKLHQLIGQMLGDLGGAASVAMVRIGDALGLYKALHAKGPMTCGGTGGRGRRQRALPARVARRIRRPRTTSPMIRRTRKFALPPEQAMVFADEDSPVYMMGGFDLMAAMLDNQPKVEEAFRTGGGCAWGEQAGCMFCAVARFFRPGYHNNLVSAWLPALDGVVDKLEERRQGGRCRMRPRLVDGDDGEGVPELAIHRLRLPSGLDRGGARARRRARRRRERLASRSARPRILPRPGSTS